MGNEEVSDFVSVANWVTFFFCLWKSLFHLEQKTIYRSDSSEKQQCSYITIVPMTTKNIKLANSAPYKRDGLEAGDLKELAKLVPAEKSLVARLPIVNDPGPHLIGIGDGIGYEGAFGSFGY